MAVKSGGKRFLLKVESLYILRAKNFVKIALSRPVSEISVFTFHTKFKMAAKRSDFCEKSPVHSGHLGVVPTR